MGDQSMLKHYHYFVLLDSDGASRTLLTKTRFCSKKTGMRSELQLQRKCQCNNIESRKLLTSKRKHTLPGKFQN